MPPFAAALLFAAADNEREALCHNSFQIILLGKIQLKRFIGSRRAAGIAEESCIKPLPGPLLKTG